MLFRYVRIFLSEIMGRRVDLVIFTLRYTRSMALNRTELRIAHVDSWRTRLFDPVLRQKSAFADALGMGGAGEHGVAAHLVVEAGAAAAEVFGRSQFRGTRVEPVLGEDPFGEDLNTKGEEIDRVMQGPYVRRTFDL